MADLRVVAASPPGSGWDQVAQTLKTIAEALPESERIEVVNVPGNGGTVGLGKFLADDDSGLLVTGLTMLDATLLQRAPVLIDRMTPIARLAAEPFAVVVPTGSPFMSADDLRTALWQEPGRLTWAGGPAGNIDHVAAALFARAIGVDPLRLNYVPFLATGDAVAALADGKVSAAIVSLGEVTAEGRNGRLRLLGLTTPEGEIGDAAPSLSSLGIPLVFANWRGLLGRPAMGEADRTRLSGLTTRLTNQPDWQALLDRKGWRPAFLGPVEFGQFLRDEQARMKDALKSIGTLKRPD